LPFLEEVQARLSEAGAGRREATMQAAESALASFIEKIKGVPSAIKEAAKQGSGFGFEFEEGVFGGYAGWSCESGESGLC